MEKTNNYFTGQQIKIGVGAIIIKNGKTLLAKRKAIHAKSLGHWGSMGGHLEYGETPAQAVVREAKEELGIEIGNLKLVSVINWLKENSHYIDLTFTAEIVSGDPTICEPDAIEEIGWFDLDKLPCPLFDFVKIPLQTIKSGNVYYEIKE